MGQSLRQIKLRIRSIGNTRKVTAAMEMISVVKLRRTENMLNGFRPYFSRFESLFLRLAGSTELGDNPFFKPPEPGRGIALCVISSDNGLCGSYNTAVLRSAEQFIVGCGQQEITLFLIGTKGIAYFRNKFPGFPVAGAYSGLNGRYADAVCEEITAKLTALYLEGKVGQVRCVHTGFASALAHKPTVVKFLPLEPVGRTNVEYIAEPRIGAIIAEFLPQYVRMKVRFMLLQAFTAEHAARTVAMKAATDNAKELLESLVLSRNKIRQTHITQDIMEIIASSEALKG